MTTRSCFAAFILSACLFMMSAQAEVIVGSKVPSCAEDPGCINRIHSGAPMAVSAVSALTVIPAILVLWSPRFLTRERRGRRGKARNEQSKVTDQS